MAGGLFAAIGGTPAARGAVALALALAAAGCAGTDSSSSGSAGAATTGYEARTTAEQDMKDRAARLQATVFEGAVLGGAAGTGLGLTFGGRQGASFGLPVGLLAGTVAGNYVAEKQRQYDDEEAALEAITADLAATNQQVAGLITVMQQVVDQQRAEIASLRAQVAIGGATEQQLQASVAHAEGNLAVMREAQADATEKRDFFVDTRSIVLRDTPAADVAPLDAEITGLSQRIATMNALVADLAQEV